MFRILSTAVLSLMMVFLLTGCGGGDGTEKAEDAAKAVGTEHPQAEHPKAEHPKSDHPNSEHPSADDADSSQAKSEHPKSEHPKSDHPN